MRVAGGGSHEPGLDGAPVPARALDAVGAAKVLFDAGAVEVGALLAAAEEAVVVVGLKDGGRLFVRCLNHRSHLVYVSAQT